MVYRDVRRTLQVKVWLNYASMIINLTMAQFVCESAFMVQFSASNPSDTTCRLLISQDVGKIGFRQISLNIYILYQK